MIDRFRTAVEGLEKRYANNKEVLSDEAVETELHKWLDECDPLPWANLEKVTADEWFFVTTLYGQMTPKGQRTHIRKYFTPLFVQAAKRDIRNFEPSMSEFDGLRYPWMKQRLCKMAAVLINKQVSMSEYVCQLRELETHAEPFDHQPALDQIKQDLGVGEAKTISVFVRDCIKGNCFPIDSRVSNELKRWGLPEDERQLVGLTLAIGQNPRIIARMFYNAGGN